VVVLMGAVETCYEALQRSPIDRPRMVTACLRRAMLISPSQLELIVVLKWLHC
jgi:hypothetical protein